MELLKKITTKDVCGDIRKILYAGDGMKEGEKKPIMRIFGQVVSAQEKETDKGPYIDLKGRFRAVNILTLEEFASGRCILVDEAAIPLMTQLRMDDVNGVEFAYDVGITAREDAIRGYEYNVTPLVEASEDDPLERLVSSLPKLPAPKAVAKETAKA